MRRVHRVALPPAAESYLARKQAALDALGANASAAVERSWKSARQTRAITRVVATLRTMAGDRERCMYCVDSHGSDIEHFRPKTPWPSHAFRWANLLLCCTECGRLKGDRFPMRDGQPLLLDPSAEDPWDHLDFDPGTGNITARYDLVADAPSVRGQATVAALQLDRREGMAEAYRRTYRRLRDVVPAAVASAAPVDGDALVTDLARQDDHGLFGWCFIGAGAVTEPFASFASAHPEAWAVCVAAGSSGAV